MNTGRGGVEVESTEVMGSDVREEETSREEVRLAVERDKEDLLALLRFKFEREKVDVMFDSIPKVRDFGIR